MQEPTQSLSVRHLTTALLAYRSEQTGDDLGIADDPCGRYVRLFDFVAKIERVSSSLEHVSAHTLVGVPHVTFMMMTVAAMSNGSAALPTRFLP